MMYTLNKERKTNKRLDMMYIFNKKDKQIYSKEINTYNIVQNIII